MLFLDLTGIYIQRLFIISSDFTMKKREFMSNKIYLKCNIPSWKSSRVYFELLNK